MRKIILFLLSFTPVISIAQINYGIKGNLEKIDAPAKIFMIYKEDNLNKIDSAVIKDHQFEFRGKVKDTSTANMVVDYKGEGLNAIARRANLDGIQVYLVNGQTVLTSSDSLYKATVTGSSINQELVAFNKLMLPATRMMTQNNTEKQFEEAEQMRAELSKKYLKENPDSYISLDRALPNIAGGYTDFNEAEPLFMSLSEKVRSTSIGVAYQKMLNALKRTVIGVSAPEFAQADVSGNLVKLSDFKGKYVLIDFWASWCAPCRAENPNLVKAYNRYKVKNFTVLGVSLDRPNDKVSWIKAIHDDGLNWTQVSDLKYWNNEAVLLYGVQAVPQNFLIDPDGKIIAKNLFGDDLENKLVELFGKI